MQGMDEIWDSRSVFYAVSNKQGPNAEIPFVAAQCCILLHTAAYRSTLRLTYKNHFSPISYDFSCSNMKNGDRIIFPIGETGDKLILIHTNQPEIRTGY